MERKYIANITVGYLLGALLLYMASSLQKMLIGLNPPLMGGYIVPLLFGGVGGAVISYLIQREKDILTESNKALQSEIMRRKRAERALEERTRELAKRIKELSCLYGISHLILGKPRLPLTETMDEALQQIVNIVASCWQHPEVVCARIIIDNQEFRTDNFKETPWKLSAPILVDGRQAGVLEVCYLEQMPERDEGPFLKEEGFLIEAVAERVGKLVEHKMVEEELQKSEQRYRTLLDDVIETSAVGIIILDKHFRVVWVNRAIERYFGLHRDELIGKDERELIEEKIKHIFEQPERFAERVLATYDDNTYIEHFECHVLAGQGREERWLEHWSQPIRSGLYAGGRIEQYADITERKKAQEKLQEEVKFSHTLVQASPAFFVAISAEGRTLMMNDSMLDALGYTLDEVVGTDYLSTFIPENERAMVADTFKRIVRLGGPTLSENHVLTKEGRKLLVEWHGRPIFKQSGELDYFFGVGLNITEQRRLEELKRQAYEQLESNIEVFATLVDKIRNPLSVISGLCELEMGERSRMVKEQIERIDEIIRQLDEGWVSSENVREFLRRNM